MCFSSLFFTSFLKSRLLWVLPAFDSTYPTLGERSTPQWIYSFLLISSLFAAGALFSSATSSGAEVAV